tara:strand:- start:200 stop:661 length:462 start_codon:yes stop_codon:yes gene_type:complete
MTNYEDASTLVFNYIDYNVLKTIAELELLIGNMRLAGATNEAILAVINNDLATRGRIFGTYVNGITSATNLGITSSAQIAEFLTYREAGYEEFKWVAVSKNPCPQCAERAGRVESKESWEALGYPRSGFSICGSNCKCHLEPVGYTGKDVVIL